MKKNYSLLLLSALFFTSSFLNAQCPTITCPSNITVNNDSGVCSAVVNFTPPVGTNPCGAGSQTFNYTGAMQTWTVPAGITSITVDAYGAQGGTSGNPNGGNGIGGLGGRTQGTVPVIPNEVLQIYVGGAGTQAPYPGMGGSGYNGGGNGASQYSTDWIGAGGGGASDVRRTPYVLGNRLVVAGGGGGGGSNGSTPNANFGGIGGGLTAGTGGSITNLGQGGGGTQVSGGSEMDYGGFCPEIGIRIGLLGIGGQACNQSAGGGGGGGYYGGGGGEFGGGGGGSNYTDPTVTGVTNTAGVQSGDGQVIISWTGGSTTTTQTGGLPSGSVFPVGTTTQTYTATDQLLNTATCSFDITVIDNEAPVPDIANLPDVTAECSATVSIYPTATDNCSGAITATTTDPTTYNTQGNFTINWSYDDGNGNITTQTQNVIIDDVTPPTFTCPTDFTTCAGTPLSIAPSAVTDNCGAVAVTYTLAGATTASGVDDASGEVFNPGVTTVTYTFDDGNGNTANCGFDVTINTVDTSVTVNNFTLTANATGTYQWYNCGTSTNIPGETNASYTATVNGSYAVIVTQNGCTDTSSCHIINSIGIEENTTTSAILIYPNPTNGQFTLVLNTDANIEVFNILGSLIYSSWFEKGKHNLSLNLFEGVYMLKSTTEKDSRMVRMVIQKNK